MYIRQGIRTSETFVQNLIPCFGKYVSTIIKSLLYHCKGQLVKQLMNLILSMLNLENLLIDKIIWRIC